MKRILLLLLLVSGVFTLNAQNVAIKNNLLYDAALTPNLGVEIGLGKVTTLDISGSYNPFRFSDYKMWKHWLVQPEFRVWTCERFNGGFWGVHAHGGEYNWAKIELPFGMKKSLRDHRYEGWFLGAGISYGYQWVLSKHWSLEATVGAGFARVYYEKYDCYDCSPQLEKGYTTYWGPTKLGVSFLFFL